MGKLFEEVDRAYASACRLQSVELEVTHRCICRCSHCYLVGLPGEELCTEEIGRLLRELRDEGVIYLTVTGGEPFLRDDLPRVLEFAHRERFLTTILTTGIPIGVAEAGLLERTGVAAVEMSLLGATADTHDSLMGYHGAFGKLREAIGRLREAGIKVALKATLLGGNYRELPDMRDLARSLGVPFSASRLVAPAIDGNPAPQRSMLSADQAAELDAVLPPEVHPDTEPGNEGAVLACRAGITVCAISPSGDVLPCVLFRRAVGNIRKNNLRDIWHDRPDPFLEHLRKIEPEDVGKCFSCASRRVCLRCPGIAWSETGDATGISPGACRLAGVASS